MSAVIPWSERHTWDAKITMHHATYLVFSFIFTVKLSCFGRFIRTTPIAFATLWGRILILIGARHLNNAMWKECSFVRGDKNAVKEHRNKSGMSYSLFTFTAAPTLLRWCQFFCSFASIASSGQRQADGLLRQGTQEKDRRIWEMSG